MCDISQITLESIVMSITAPESEVTKRIALKSVVNKGTALAHCEKMEQEIRKSRPQEKFWTRPLRSYFHFWEIQSSRPEAVARYTNRISA